MAMKPLTLYNHDAINPYENNNTFWQNYAIHIFVSIIGVGLSFIIAVCIALLIKSSNKTDINTAGLLVVIIIFCLFCGYYGINGIISENHIQISVYFFLTTLAEIRLWIAFFESSQFDEIQSNPNVTVQLTLSTLVISAAFFLLQIFIYLYMLGIIPCVDSVHSIFSYSTIYYSNYPSNYSTNSSEPTINSHSTSLLDSDRAVIFTWHLFVTLLLVEIQFLLVWLVFVLIYNNIEFIIICIAEVIFTLIWALWGGVLAINYQNKTILMKLFLFLFPVLPAGIIYILIYIFGYIEESSNGFLNMWNNNIFIIGVLIMLVHLFLLYATIKLYRYFDSSDVPIKLQIEIYEAQLLQRRLNSRAEFLPSENESL